jgi:hypothetical protein
MPYMLLFLSLLFCDGTYAVSDNPSNLPSVPIAPETKQKETKPETPQRGTEESPLFVKGDITTQKSKAEADKEEADSLDQSALEKSNNFFYGLAGWAAFAACVVALVQGGLFVWQLIKMNAATKAARDSADAARDSVITMQETAKRQLRAYVGAYSITVENFTLNSRPLFKYKPTNSGQTPAYNLTAKILFSIHDNPDRKKVFFAATKITPAVVGPGQSITQSIEGRLLDQRLYDACMRKETFCMVCGVIKYTDAFKRRHRTTFRTYVDVSVLKDGAGAMTCCLNNNRAD